MIVDPRVVARPCPVNAAKVIALSLALVSLFFALQGNVGINFADEGFLWYGTQRTALGEVPLRDFQSYDPGRYYWGAAWLKMFGDGIVSLRISAATVQFVGLVCGLLTLHRVLSAWSLLVPAGVVLLLWMHPLYRVFEPTAAMCAVYVAVRLLENPTLRAHCAAGAFVGLAAVLGRNHGVYGAVAFVLIILFQRLTTPPAPLLKRLLGWAAAIPVGYSPMLALSGFPGFVTAFADGLMAMFASGTTNIARPVPWPWRVYPYVGHLDLSLSIPFLALGSLFLLVPTFYGFVAAFLIGASDRASRHPVLIASTVIGAIYTHYAFSRADLEHLALSIHPFLIGVIALPTLLAGRLRTLVAIITVAGLVLLSCVTVGVASPGYFRLASPAPYVKAEIGRDTLWLDPGSAALIERIKSLNARLVAPGEGLLLGPHLPMFYSILQRKSPLWEIYFLLPPSVTKQREAIQQLQAQNVNWAIIHDVALDGRDALRFRNTHPILWQHLLDEFDRIPTRDLPTDFYLLHRRASPVRSF